ncbi:transcriptional regulator with XRE-family HTH domain [Luteibacter sp. Sphag1AF]|uniref:helix-turn-helix domain-containing protein n=1 Tax=Luteibacter sp. Sphag1AF TaxID=2587031 RepID=UPI00161D2827|nr:helix-turn-helix domain-containing protein [Luteibacter sp. Sphag1AF]MBB3227506.1 transcriptional regulator with XRE-family HTH domain [Luteibacter sp. Sphag1AF]
MAGLKKGRGRTTQLADLFDVSRETARKWLNAEGLPELARQIDMAVRFGVNFEWLATGRGAPDGATGVREAPAMYRPETRDQLRLVGLVTRLPRERRNALLVLVEALAEV